METPQQPPPPASQPGPVQTKLKRRPKQVTNPLVQKKGSSGRPATASRPAQAGLANGLGSNSNSRTGNANRPEEYDEIPITTTKRALLDNLKHHVIRLLPNISAEQQVINLCNEKQFERPIKLHRRDPRANNTGQLVKDEADAGKPGNDVKAIDDKERERQQIAKAEKQAEREKLQAETAPTTKNVQPKKKKFRKHLDQPHTYSDKVEKKDMMSIRYEEKLPWHIEDFQDKQVWRGTYETALSQNHVALIAEQGPSGKFYRMIPLEKWYKFTPKDQIENPLSYEAVERAMQKGARDPLWLRKNAAKLADKNKADAERGQGRSFYSRKGERGEQSGGGRIKSEGDDDEIPETAADIDDIDYNYDEDFADDEEGPELVGQEEEEQAKEVDEKVKREMRDAPVFDIKEEKDFDAEEEAQKLKDHLEKRTARKTQRALMKREKNFAYEQDSDGNPYESETESDDSEAERQKEEERKHEEERKATEGAKGHKPGDAPSGASTHGANTPVPAHRPSKVNGPLRGALKRPGSPNLSEASGNESGAARKKHKKKQYTASTLGVPDGAGISRTASPANGMPNGATTLAAPQAQRPVRLNVDGNRATSGAASGSDVEMSDGSRGTRLKRIKTSKPGSPSGSRPGSPNGVPVKKKRPVPVQQSSVLPSVETLLSLIPATGIPLTELLLVPPISAVTKHPGFNTFFKRHATMEAGTKVVWQKGKGPPHVLQQEKRDEAKKEKDRQRLQQQQQQEQLLGKEKAEQQQQTTQA